MTQEDINKYNPIIAVFMGYRLGELRQIGGDEPIPALFRREENANLKDFTFPHLLDYHSNWNALMEVVEKLWYMGYKVIISQEGCDTYDKRPDGKYGNTISCHSMSDDDDLRNENHRQAVYRSVVGVIEWLNNKNL